MSKTPICDRWEYDTNQGGLVVPLNVAKDLETELAEARAEVEKATATEAERWAERLNWLHTKYGADCSGTDSADLLDCVEDEIKQVINSQSELIEQMRDALQACAEFIHYYDQEHNIGDGKVLEQALVALSAAERGEE